MKMPVNNRVIEEETQHFPLNILEINKTMSCWAMITKRKNITTKYKNIKNMSRSLHSISDTVWKKFVRGKNQRISFTPNSSSSSSPYCEIGVLFRKQIHMCIILRQRRELAIKFHMHRPLIQTGTPFF